MKSRKDQNSYPPTGNRSLQLLTPTLVVSAIAIAAVSLFQGPEGPAKVAGPKGIDLEISSALFTKQEFFGSRAIVAYETKRARANLASLLKKYPDEVRILSKLAEIDEAVGNQKSAESFLRRIAEIDPGKLSRLADFYQRRGRYSDQAAVLEQLFIAEKEPTRKAEFLDALLKTASKHNLGKYHTDQFYELASKQTPSGFPVIERLVDRLTDARDFSRAIELIRRAKKHFPDHRSALLEKEISVLLKVNRDEEAEEVYQRSFDVFWTDEESWNFYDFLSSRDRLRAYGSDLQKRFSKDPGDFDIALRLAHYRISQYESAVPVIAGLEANKTVWSAEELLAAARLLIREGNGELASRFLYTLYLRDDFKNQPALRKKILYQLFEIFADAERSSLTLSDGNLQFYADVATADSNPGISTGLLSLMFSDAEMGKKFARKQEVADEHFNRAAAFRLFSAFRKEFPRSTELAQMYLDLIRLYTATGEHKLAARLLGEFEREHGRTPDFAEVALRLANAFETRGRTEKAKKVYMEVLDFLGQRGIRSSLDDKDRKRTVAALSFKGISVPINPEDEERNRAYYYQPTPQYVEYLVREPNAISYPAVLGKLVDLLARQKKTLEILSLYSREISRHPKQEWLYEERLHWLEQTNLTGEQTDLYRSAIARFKTNKWREKLARYLLRRNQKKEFARFSEQLTSTLNDREIEEYLRNMVISRNLSTDFERALFRKLHISANRRFPHNLRIVRSLLRFYVQQEEEDNWFKLASRYFFSAPEIRKQFIEHLAARGQLRSYLKKAGTKNVAYKLFRAEAQRTLSRYEKALPVFLDLHDQYPDRPEFATVSKTIARSLGQNDRTYLRKARMISRSLADKAPSAAAFTESGEISAELGDFNEAAASWGKIIGTAKGSRDAYLETATIYWDYFQFSRARKVLQRIREQENDETLYAFEMGAILESEHKRREAISEYVKALDTQLHDEEQMRKSKRRLAALITRDRAAARIVEAAFKNEIRKRNKDGALVLSYANALYDSGKKERAVALLNAEIRSNSSEAFLQAALRFYSSVKVESGRQLALRRLAAVSTNPIKSIRYKLRFAESLRGNRKRLAAASVIAGLVRRFPTNYGVLTEAVNFYKHTGFEDRAVNTLQTGFLRARGKYKLILAQKLARLHVETNRLDSAARLLADLHRENNYDPQIFRILASVYVKQNDAKALRLAFRRTVKALKQSDQERISVRRELYDLRKQMIDAFTELRDPNSALAQYIEIINRDPEATAELAESAIAYAKRYGATNVLIRYYSKLSAKSFKNYRWNLVLSKLYESAGNRPKAITNIRAAIVNDPGRSELYVSLARLEAKMRRYSRAIAAIDEAIKLTGESPELIRLKIRNLELMGKKGDARLLKKRLPSKAGSRGLFALAENSDDEAESVRLFKNAFEELLSDPLKVRMRSSEIHSYVKTLRKAESLTKVNADLWKLRAKLILLANKPGFADAGRARRRLSLLNSSIIESIGSIARRSATDEELESLFQFLSKKIDAVSVRSDRAKTLSLVQDLCRKSGFGILEVKILRKRIIESKSSTERQRHLQRLAVFYDSSGAYEKTARLYREFKVVKPSLLARSARLNVKRDAEIASLTRIYWSKGGKPSESESDEVNRLLNLLYDTDRKALKVLTENSSHYQIQLINFLLAKGQRRLAHNAIENARLERSWKLSRHAETSLALREFGAGSECYFCQALQLGTIGEMTAQRPDKRRFLINDDWFRLSREYGEWLLNVKGGDREGRQFIGAMTEHRPSDPAEQFKLGLFYLKLGDPVSSIEHFVPAIELRPNDARTQAHLGIAYLRSGRKAEARKTWSALLKDHTAQRFEIYFKTLVDFGYKTKARRDASTFLIESLRKAETNAAELSSLVGTIASTFSSGRAKADYFAKISRAVPPDTSLPALLVNESLIVGAERERFLRLLIERNDPVSSYDYQFNALARRILTGREAVESAYDQQRNFYSVEEPPNDRFQWQRQHLDVLISLKRVPEARKTIAEIEKEILNKYARPEWLKTGIIKLDVMEGRFEPGFARNFIGIDISSSLIDNVNPPNIERLNSVVRILDKSGLKRASADLRSSFFARMLALGKYEPANFAGLSRALFALGKDADALKILRLGSEVHDEDNRETALAGLDAMSLVKKARPVYGNVYADGDTTISARIRALKSAAEISAEFGKLRTAIVYRRKIAEINSSDSVNRSRLADLLSKSGRKAEASRVLKQIIADRRALRPIRWEARHALYNSGDNIRLRSRAFDSYSLQLLGFLKEAEGKKRTAIALYVDSLIADAAVQTGTRRSLTRLYALTRRDYAAITFAGTIKNGLSDKLARMLSESAERLGEFGIAIKYENLREVPDRERLAGLKRSLRKKEKKRTDLKVSLENTRDL